MRVQPTVREREEEEEEAGGFRWRCRGGRGVAVVARSVVPL